MQPYYELAYALASESLCLFVGTGFSKHLTGGAAPDWKTLLKQCCSALANPDQLIDELFPGGQANMPLEECASIISLQMKKEGKDIYGTIADEILKLQCDPAIAKPIRDFAAKHPSLRFITTNYDLLIEDDILDGKHTAFCPGFPVNRQRMHNEVYHIHGAVKFPEGMVVTADDYYRFINFPNYFSKRLDTLIEENTTVIIGYSLGDINFKSILNAHRYSSSHAVNRQHLFYLSRKKVPQHVKDYYDASYGLRVIDSTEIPDLFAKIDTQYDAIEKDVKAAKDQLQRVLLGETTYTDSYLKKRESFAKILATISSTGFRITHPRIIDFLKDTIQRKHGFTREDGAWSQYEQLADWLIQLGCVMDLEGTPLEGVYLEAVKTSFHTMSRIKIFGKSWDTYKTWYAQWGELTFKNRAMIRKFVSEKGLVGDYEEFIDT